MAKRYKTHSKYTGIVVNETALRKLKDNLAATREDVAEFLVFRLEQMGEKAIEIARQNGSYGDVTGNLRSSIGYVITDNGKVVMQAEPEQYQGTQGDGSKGVSEMQSYLESIKGDYPKGCALVVCAAMEYAAFVENVKKKDVLTSAKHYIETIAPKQLDELTDSI